MGFENITNDLFHLAMVKDPLWLHAVGGLYAPRGVVRAARASPVPETTGQLSHLGRNGKGMTEGIYIFDISIFIIVFTLTAFI